IAPGWAKLNEMDLWSGPARLLLNPGRVVEVAVLSALGSFLAQIIEKNQKKRGLDLAGPLRFFIYGFFFTGPLSHYFYLYLERWFPSDVPVSIAKRLLLDRLVVAPAFLVLYYFVMNLLEGKDTSAFVKRMKSSYWTSLKMNWKVWTPVQFINLNYVPMQVRGLAFRLAAAFWINCSFQVTFKGSPT
uniref:Peroxisomal membrane protein 2 n=1 Tax=Podarcis muralis TaxID=64176 RepID=A0A670JP85_PODMU